MSDSVLIPVFRRQDVDVIAACNGLCVPIIFTGRRHYKHAGLARAPSTRSKTHFYKPNAMDMCNLF